MTDHFAVLGLEPSPLLAEDVLQSEYEQRSRQLHPDLAGGNGEEFRSLQAAFQVLRDPAQRLRHLLELRAPDLIEKPNAPGGDLVGIFMEVGEALQSLGAFEQREKAISSPLGRALLAPEKMALIERLQALQAILENARKETLLELKELSSDWDSAGNLVKLAGLQQRLAFLGKWTGTLRERLMETEL